MMSTCVKIASITVGVGGAASIDFSSIPATYDDLKLVVSGRGDGTNQTVRLRVNNDTTGADYTQKELYGTGSVAGSLSGNPGDVGYLPDSTITANVFGSMEIYIPNYLSANYKSISSDSVAENNSTAGVQKLGANLWLSTAAINQLTLYLVSGNFVQYSMATLYGIKNS